MRAYKILQFNPEWFNEAVQGIAIKKEQRNKMKVTVANLDKNTEVLLASDKYHVGSQNPKGIKGKITGLRHVGNVPWITVSWENGHSNSYEENTLEYVPAPAKITLTLTPTSTVSAPVTATPVAASTQTRKAVSLTTAIENVIKNEFVAKNLSFSGYDVTSKLRREVNESRILLENVPFEVINGVNTQKITHDDVRVLVRQVANTISNYKPEFNGDYIVYKPVAQSPVSAPSTTNRLIFTPTGQTSSPVSFASVAGPSPKLVTYISSKGSRTLKQIQSRFKVTGTKQITIRELATIAQSSGLRIDVKTPYYQSVVTK